MLSSTRTTVLRVVLAAVAVGSLALGVGLDLDAAVWAPLATVAAVAAIALELSRRRAEAAAARRRERREPDHRERDDAVRVAVPWRSSAFWDDFDRRLTSARQAESFCFYGHAGDSIVVTAEVPNPGRGVTVSLFDADELHAPLAEGSSDQSGVVVLEAATATTGIHNVVVRTAGSLEDEGRAYRLSIAGPRRAREAGPGADRAEGFADVPLWHAHHDAVRRVVELGLMSGRHAGGDDRFGPDHPVWWADLSDSLDNLLTAHGEDAGALLLPWDEGPGGGVRVIREPGSCVGQAEALAGSMPPDPVRTVSRKRAVLALVRATDLLVPGILAEPSVDLEPLPGLDPDTRRALAVAEFGGLLVGLGSYLDDVRDLDRPATRGEVAQLLDTVLDVLGGAAALGATPASGRSTAPPPHGDPVGWDSDQALALDFIDGANEALEALVGAHVTGEVPAHQMPEIDAGALRATIDAMREQHEERRRERRGATAVGPSGNGGHPRASGRADGDTDRYAHHAQGDGPAPAADSESTAATRNGSGESRADVRNGSSDALSTLRRRNRRVLRYKPRS